MRSLPNTAKHISRHWYTNRNTFGWREERKKEMFYLTTHSTHFIYGYMASDIWLRTILIVRKETRCRHIGYSYRLAARVLLYAPSHRQDNTYHGLCYTSRGALAGTRNSSMGPPHEGSIRRPTAPWANALPLSYVPLPGGKKPNHRMDSLGWFGPRTQVPRARSLLTELYLSTQQLYNQNSNTCLKFQMLGFVYSLSSLSERK